MLRQFGGRHIGTCAVLIQFPPAVAHIGSRRWCSAVPKILPRRRTRPSQIHSGGAVSLIEKLRIA
jgi:hypothetical protein